MKPMQLTESESKETLEKLRESGKIIHLSRGVHGQIFMSINTGFLKQYESYKQTLEEYKRIIHYFNQFKPCNYTI